MAKSLVIVESDAKSKTINKFLGKDYVVKASVGHIKNLPKNRLGINIENQYEPEYITIRGRGKILSELKRIASNSDKIYIATDPDREGEAIAAHLANEIQASNTNIHRVLFHEITKEAVQQAVSESSQIDADKVEAQKARRVMDRIVGYEVSPFLWKTIYRGLSAGRVQSVALRLICEREEEVKAFEPEEYWSVEAHLKTKEKEAFVAKLTKLGDDPLKIGNEKEMQKHVDLLEKREYVVSDVKKKEVKRNPYPPYTTSTLQQDAARKLNMSTKQIMAIAQQLYEGIDLKEGRVGLITYMRTDSTRLAESAVDEARQYIADNYGVEYVPKTPKLYKNKKSAQDAHEAIRPTSMSRPPNSVASVLTPNQKKLYTFIWNRYVACQMAPAKLNQTVIDVCAGEYLFRATGQQVKFRGFMQIYEMDKEEVVKLPKKIEKKDPLDLDKLDPEQHFTKPPARYNESSLVKELDQLGIGRPSTYALIITTILDRKYVERESRSLKPTDLGGTVNGILTDQFPDIFNVKFTSRMESELDQIEAGEKKRVDVMDHFYVPFKKDVEQAMEKKDEIKESLQEEKGDPCPECGKELIVKWGRNGKFIACSGYPDCKYTAPVDEQETESDQICPNCSSPMMIKTGRFGRFLACTKYPDCKTTLPIPVGVDCPKEDCNGHLVEKRSRRGKIFYGCSNYPDCDFATWYKPVPKKCPSCGYGYLEARYNKASGNFLQCPSCKNKVDEET